MIKFEDLNKADPERKVRITETKAIIGGKAGERGPDSRYTLHMKKGKFGRIKVLWHGFVEVPTEESIRCDMGHRHPKVVKERFVWNEVDLSSADVQALREFLK